MSTWGYYHLKNWWDNTDITKKEQVIPKPMSHRHSRMPMPVMPRHGNAIRISGSLWGNPPITGGFPPQKANNAELCFSSGLLSRISCWTNNRVAGDWSHHVIDVTNIIVDRYGMSLVFSKSVRCSSFAVVVLYVASCYIGPRHTGSWLICTCILSLCYNQ